MQLNMFEKPIGSDMANFKASDLTTHHKENNRESEAFFEANIDHFTGQTKDVFNHLSKGFRINPDSAKELYKIRHLARRIKDIREYFEATNSDKIVDDIRLPNRCKEYFIALKINELQGNDKKSFK